LPLREAAKADQAEKACVALLFFTPAPPKIMSHFRKSSPCLGKGTLAVVSCLLQILGSTA